MYMESCGGMGAGTHADVVPLCHAALGTPALHHPVPVHAGAEIDQTKSVLWALKGHCVTLKSRLKSI